MDSPCTPLYDSLRPLLSAIPDDEKAFAIITAMTEAFKHIQDPNSRYSIIYTCLRLATLAIPSLRRDSPSPDSGSHSVDQPFDTLDYPNVTYEGFVLQGQTMTALWAITEGILRDNGISCATIKPIQSDRYLALRPKLIASKPSSVLIVDEVIRRSLTLNKATERVMAHFHTSFDTTPSDDLPYALLAQRFDPDCEDRTAARQFHVDVARVLACNLRPHATASCYSLPIHLTRTQYCAVVHEFLTTDRKPFYPWTPIHGPVAWTDTVPWNVTDTYTFIRSDDDTYCNTGVTRLTSLLTGSMLSNLSDKLGFPWFTLLADARVDWHILSQEPGSVDIRFVPQVILNPISITSLKSWYVHLTNFTDQWSEDHSRAAYDLLRAALSSVVFDVWSDQIARSRISATIPALYKDTGAATLIMGPDIAPLALNPNHQLLKLLQPDDPLFSSSAPLHPHLGKTPERALNQPFPCPTSEETILPFYDLMNPGGHPPAPAENRKFHRITDLLAQICQTHGLNDAQRLEMRCDIALFAATAGDTWIRSECKIVRGIAHPAWRSAEVAPCYADFPGTGPHIGGIASYSDLPDWGAES